MAFVLAPRQPCGRGPWSPGHRGSSHLLLSPATIGPDATTVATTCQAGAMGLCGAAFRIHRQLRKVPANELRERRDSNREHEDGTPADPPVLHTAVPNWSAGDTIALSADRMLRVIETRLEDEELVLVVGTEVAPHHCRGVVPALLRHRSGGGSSCGSFPLPVAVEGSLYFHEPNDRRDEQDRARKEP